MNNPSTEMEFAINLAREAGANMRMAFERHLVRRMLRKLKPEDHTPLTETDQRNDDLIRERVAKDFPGVALITEEGEIVTGTGDIAAVGDPVDGTIPFSNGVPTSVFSFAFTRAGKPFVAVIYDPFTNKMYTAELGKGAFCNDERVSVGGNKKLDKGLIVGMGWGYSQRDMSLVDLELRRRSIVILELCTCAYSGAMVASGHFDISAYPVWLPWDVAAVDLLVKEAGGVSTDLFGNEQLADRKVNGCLVANPWLHEEFAKLNNTLIPREEINGQKELKEKLRELKEFSQKLISGI